jgi:hypothetical protein
MACADLVRCTHSSNSWASGTSSPARKSPPVTVWLDGPGVDRVIPGDANLVTVDEQMVGDHFSQRSRRLP